jgi:hypothetical protein
MASQSPRSSFRRAQGKPLQDSISSSSWLVYSVITVPAYRREPVGYAYAVVDRHPGFAVLFFLLFFLAHDLDELS